MEKRMTNFLDRNIVGDMNNIVGGSKNSDKVTTEHYIKQPNFLFKIIQRSDINYKLKILRVVDIADKLPEERSKLFKQDEKKVKLLVRQFCQLH